MNRRYGAAEYLDIVAKLRAARPDLALSGDFIVGFPGETEEDFQATLALVREARYAQAFSFMYSPRPGTPAATLPHQVAPEVKAERLARLQSLLTEQQRAFNRACVGRELDLLIEKPGRKPGQMVGRTPYLQSAHLEAASRTVGEIVRVRVDAALPNSLSASPLPSSAAAA
jgi:tRNA-2-methylthio-N6-dimethylallyladenosine synthase